MIRAVAWDIDGTLVDSEPAHHLALLEVSARYGAPLTAEQANFTGVAIDDVWEILSPLYPPSLSRSAWIDAIVDVYVAAATKLEPIPGAREAALKLQDWGAPQGCVSNSERRIVEANLQAIGLTHCFAFAIAREDVARGKPDPEPYVLACRRFGLPPAQVLAVEDSDAGADSARAAGLTVIRVDPAGEAFAAVVAAVRAGGFAP